MRAFGYAAQSQTTVSYADAARTVTVTLDLNTYGDNVLKGETVYDGLGRTVRTRQYETATEYVLA